MVIIMKPNFTQVQLEAAIREMEAAGVKVMISKGSETTSLGAEGNASRIDKEKMEQLSRCGTGHGGDGAVQAGQSEVSSG